MEKRLNVSKVILIMAVVLLPAFWPALAEYGYGGESQIQSFFDGTSGFLVKTVGTGVLLLGLISTGIKMTTGDHEGLRKSIMVMIGGAIIFLSKSVVDLLSKFAGGNF